jgi:hypothetical protein
MKKKIIIGWVNKHNNIENVAFWVYRFGLEQLHMKDGIFRKKGKLANWHRSDQPPKKIKITIEEI